MPLNMDNSDINHLNLPFRINSDSFCYLGVNITKRHNSLLQENFEKLLISIKKNLSDWSVLPISLIGRVNAIKMTVLPKFLYLFQCIPLFIPGSYFKKLDSAISSYVWNNKNPRLRRDLLRRAKQDGGLGLPDLRLYYWAANINCMAYWSFYHQRTAPPGSRWRSATATQFPCLR